MNLAEKKALGQQQQLVEIKMLNSAPYLFQVLPSPFLHRLSYTSYSYKVFGQKLSPSILTILTMSILTILTMSILTITLLLIQVPG